MSHFKCSLVILIFVKSFLLFTSVVNGQSELESEWECTEFCEHFRKSSKNFTINCEDPIYGFDAKECDHLCFDCFKNNFQEICDYEIEDNYIFNCPARMFRCKDRCDLHRPNNFLGEFTFSCDNETLFPSAWNKQLCWKDCRTCEEVKGKTSNKYYKCGYHKSKRDSKGTLVFYCPAVETFPQRPEPPLAEAPVYEGSKCEKHCDSNRPTVKDGQRDSYRMSCSKAYHYDAKGKEDCVKDCSTCPFDVCDPYEQIYGTQEFHYGKKLSVSYNCPVSAKVGRPKPPSPSKFWLSWTIIGLNAILVVGCIVASSFYGNWDVNRRIENTIEAETGEPSPVQMSSLSTNENITPNESLVEQQSVAQTDVVGG